MRILIRTMFAIGLAVCLAGCGFSFTSLLPGSAAGRANVYDYSPTVIESANVRQLWWCGADYNTQDSTQFSDTIQYQSLDLSTQKKYGPVEVLAETKGAWDSVYTCNPKVVGGTFVNPLGDGENFTYAL